MKLIITLLLVFINLSAISQERRKTDVEIENYVEDLKKNIVYSVEKTKYYFKKDRKKIDSNSSKKLSIQIFDNYGRNTEEIYYSDSIDSFMSGKTKYFYADTLGKLIDRWEEYDEKDSLVDVFQSEIVNGRKMYFLKTGGVSCFGNYKLIYNDKGLISEATWYGPREGLWANDDMIPIYIVKLKYTFRD